MTETELSIKAIEDRGCSQLRLFAFQPNGFGALSFFVVAASLNEARQKVDEYVSKERPMHNEDWPTEYEVEEFYPLELAINDND